MGSVSVETRPGTAMGRRGQRRPMLGGRNAQGGGHSADWAGRCSGVEDYWATLSLHWAGNGQGLVGRRGLTSALERRAWVQCLLRQGRARLWAGRSQGLVGRRGLTSALESITSAPMFTLQAKLVQIIIILTDIAQHITKQNYAEKPRESARWRIVKIRDQETPVCTAKIIINADMSTLQARLVRMTITLTDIAQHTTRQKCVEKPQKSASWKIVRI